ncbi:undecaprenyl-diphosphate phosphatase [Alkalibacillus almallahensis]|uniref:undecaprenyl-diphosphate phosphatase n=1 Tax=Alkalibacillus almallahensis TaxID=1379154 RepID=UPI001423015F|nr:undecaprenyl-diphosphate phosphatase [Alkalibacillus almallahensis]NIK12891.1 undecaprenyl-diphosphatase [Alkalibacillus almallahensis]
MNEIMEIIQFIFLGLFQGFTEPIPISSSGHLVILRSLFDIGEPGITFEAFINFGSLIAVVTIYRRDIWQLIVGSSRYLFNRDEESKTDFRYAFLLVIATIPAGLLGVLLEDSIGEVTGKVKIVAISLILTAIALWIIRNFHGHKDDEQLTIKDAVIVGFAQAVALVPGISRSGATIVASMLVGMKRRVALRFSFLMYIPVSLGTMVFAVSDVLSNPELSGQFVLYLIALIAAIFSSYLALLLFINIMTAGKLKYFAYYCLIIGILVLVFL